MSSKILEKYADRLHAEGGDYDSVESELDLGSFGWLRGVRERAVMLELRKRDGNILAVGYGWIERMEFDPSESVTLYIGGEKLRIKGRNLNAEVRPTVRLFEGLTRHKVPWIQEAGGRNRTEPNDDATIIDSLDW